MPTSLARSAEIMVISCPLFSTFWLTDHYHSKMALVRVTNDCFLYVLQKSLSMFCLYLFHSGLQMIWPLWFQSVLLTHFCYLVWPLYFQQQLCNWLSKSGDLISTYFHLFNIPTWLLDISNMMRNKFLVFSVRSAVSTLFIPLNRSMVGWSLCYLFLIPGNCAWTFDLIWENT